MEFWVENSTMLAFFIYLSIALATNSSQLISCLKESVRFLDMTIDLKDKGQRILMFERGIVSTLADALDKIEKYERSPETESVERLVRKAIKRARSGNLIGAKRKTVRAVVLISKGLANLREFCT